MYSKVSLWEQKGCNNISLWGQRGRRNICLWEHTWYHNILQVEYNDVSHFYKHEIFNWLISSLVYSGSKADVTVYPGARECKLLCSYITRGTQVNLSPFLINWKFKTIYLKINKISNKIINQYNAILGYIVNISHERKCISQG